MNDITVTCTQQIKMVRLAELLVGALEGGSNYWYRINEFIKPPERTFIFDKDVEYRQYEYPCTPGGALIIEDMEGGEGKVYRLDIDSITKGIQLMANKYHSDFNDFCREGDDAGTSDIFLQLCLFGDVVYG